jgi:hypothetical protein
VPVAVMLQSADYCWQSLPCPHVDVLAWMNARTTYHPDSQALEEIKGQAGIAHDTCREQEQYSLLRKPCVYVRTWLPNLMPLGYPFHGHLSLPLKHTAHSAAACGSAGSALGSSPLGPVPWSPTSPTDEHIPEGARHREPDADERTHQHNLVQLLR